MDAAGRELTPTLGRKKADQSSFVVLFRLLVSYPLLINKNLVNVYATLHHFTQEVTTMHQPELNPITNRALAGRKRRNVLGTTAIRPVRLDRDTDATLTRLKQTLSGSTPEDVASVSLVIRRAIQVYSHHVERIRTDPHAMTAELETLRKKSRLPSVKPPTIQQP